MCLYLYRYVDLSLYLWRKIFRNETQPKQMPRHLCFMDSGAEQEEGGLWGQAELGSVSHFSVLCCVSTLKFPLA